MKKNYALLVFAAFAAAACSQPEINAPEGVDGHAVTITASREGRGVVSKTELQEDGSVLWSSGDRIALLWEGGSAGSKALSLSSPAEKADFTVLIPDEETPQYAVYPASSSAEYDGMSLTVTIPDVQDGSFSSAAIEVGEVAADGSTTLRNLGAMLCVEVESADVKCIKITANGDKALVGSAYVSFKDGVPVIPNEAWYSSSLTINASGAGTYYASIIPVECSEGFIVELLDSGNNIIGRKLTGNAFSFERSGLYRLGKVAAGGDGGLFVKADAADGNSGVSWDAPMSWNDLQNLIKDGPLTGNVYMAAGIYTIAADITVKAGSNFKIYGGFNPASEGSELSDRNITKYVTAFDGGGAKRLCIYNNSTSEDSFDGVTFQNAYISSTNVGSALIFQNCKSVSFNNCIIKDNKKEGSGGGTIRANKGVLTFTGCTFSGNTSAGNAAVFALTGATLTLDKCDFTGNVAKGSGSVLYCVTNASTATLTDCYFAQNESGQKGVIATGHPNGKTLLNGCRFYKNVTGTGASCIYNKCMMAVNNCAFQDNSNKAADDASTIHNDSDTGSSGVPGRLIISNTSIRLSANSGVGLLTSAMAITKTWLVNSTIMNSQQSADADKGVAVKTKSEVSSYGHNVISKLLEEVSGTYVLQNEDSDLDAVPYTLAQGWDATQRLIFWNGWGTAGKPDGFSLITPSRLEAAYDAYDSACGTTFKAILKENGWFDTDIRGQKRNSNGYWPGSYDDGANVTL